MEELARASRGELLANEGLPAVPPEVDKMFAFLKSNASGPEGFRFEPSTFGIVGGGFGQNLGGSVEKVSWKDAELALEGRIQPIRESLDSGEEIPVGTTVGLVGTTLVQYLRALPDSVIPAEVAEKIDRLEVGPTEASQVLGKLGGWRDAVMIAILDLFRLSIIGQDSGGEMAFRDLGEFWEVFRKFYLPFP